VSSLLLLYGFFFPFLPQKISGTYIECNSLAICVGSIGMLVDGCVQLIAIVNT